MAWPIRLSFRPLPLPSALGTTQAGTAVGFGETGRSAATEAPAETAPGADMVRERDYKCVGRCVSGGSRSVSVGSVRRRDVRGYERVSPDCRVYRQTPEEVRASARRPFAALLRSASETHAFSTRVAQQSFALCFLFSHYIRRGRHGGQIPAEGSGRRDGGPPNILTARASLLPSAASSLRGRGPLFPELGEPPEPTLWRTTQHPWSRGPGTRYKDLR